MLVSKEGGWRNKEKEKEEEEEEDGMVYAEEAGRKQTLRGGRMVPGVPGGCPGPANTRLAAWVTDRG
ncbi:hypothetical protein E2C01_083938 [Portunus trituberculatus]|uniref:Uncharacterized protein n=1 Tax=Portunus trituberculatus TaxID=210409 RepID=A0A5B7IWI0_PORTR|nr:hypothetical protein [Portunus trituberculatus]